MAVSSPTLRDTGKRLRDSTESVLPFQKRHKGDSSSSSSSAKGKFPLSQQLRENYRLIITESAKLQLCFLTERVQVYHRDRNKKSEGGNSPLVRKIIKYLDTHPNAEICIPEVETLERSQELWNRLVKIREVNNTAALTNSLASRALSHESTTSSNSSASSFSSNSASITFVSGVESGLFSAPQTASSANSSSSASNSSSHSSASVAVVAKEGIRASLMTQTAHSISSSAAVAAAPPMSQSFNAALPLTFQHLLIASHVAGIQQALIPFLFQGAIPLYRVSAPSAPLAMSGELSAAAPAGGALPSASMASALVAEARTPLGAIPLDRVSTPLTPLDLGGELSLAAASAEGTLASASMASALVAEARTPLGAIPLDRVSTPLNPLDLGGELSPAAAPGEGTLPSASVVSRITPL